MEIETAFEKFFIVLAFCLLGLVNSVQAQSDPHDQSPSIEDQEKILKKMQDNLPIAPNIIKYNRKLDEYGHLFIKDTNQRKKLLEEIKEDNLDSPDPAEDELKEIITGMLPDVQKRNDLSLSDLNIKNLNFNKKCPKANLIFALDQSQSISNKNSIEMFKALASVINSLIRSHQDAFKLSLFEFNHQISKSTDLSEFNTYMQQINFWFDYIEMLNTQPFGGRPTNHNIALEKVYSILRNDEESENYSNNRDNLVIYVSDGLGLFDQTKPFIDFIKNHYEANIFSISPEKQNKSNHVFLKSLASDEQVYYSNYSALTEAIMTALNNWCS